MELPRDSDQRLSAYAWPGGYPIFYLLEDNGVLCPACANGENGSDASVAAGTDPQWHIVAADIHWEGDALVCDHCYGAIESAYGPIEEDARS